MTVLDLNPGQLYRWSGVEDSPVLMCTEPYEGVYAVVVVPSSDGRWRLGELVWDVHGAPVELEE